MVFDPAHNKQLASVILALITCRSFYYYVVNYKHEKKIIVFLRKLLVQLGQGNTDNKYIIQSILNEISNYKKKEITNSKDLTKYTEITNSKDLTKYTEIISELFEDTPLNKLLGLTRTDYGYCNICKLAGTDRIHKIPVYKLNKHTSQQNDFDLEDNLYVERVYKPNVFTCYLCKNSYDYLVSLTIQVPEIIVISTTASVKNSTLPLKIPKELTIPCKQNTTFYYSLVSYIHEDNKKNIFVTVLKNEPAVPHTRSIDNSDEINPTDTKTLLLFYNKIGSLNKLE